jgi:hypothetical protein
MSATETWNASNGYEMARFVAASGLALDDDDTRLVRRLFDEHDTIASVYDLHRLNMLCQQAIGWAKRGRSAIDLATENAAVRAEANRSSNALKNVRMLAMRLRKSDPINADHLVRFCADAGIVGSVLR